MEFDLAFLVSQLPALGKGLLLTLEISLAAIILSMVGGFFGGAVRAHRIVSFNVILAGYVEVIRNTPLPVQLFFIYFGLPGIGVTISGVAAAILALTFFGTAYAIENFRAGFEAVPQEMKTAGRALGMSTWDIFLRLEAPVAVRVSVRPLGNTAILILKDSSVVYLISVHDLTYTAVTIVAVSYRVVEMFAVLGGVYLTLVLGCAALVAAYERHLRLTITV